MLKSIEYFDKLASHYKSPLTGSGTPPHSSNLNHDTK